MMMKYLLLLIVLAVVAFMLGVKRSRPPERRSGTPPAPPAPPPQAQPKTIVSCAQCGLHLPRDEALPGLGGLFCGPAHRAAYEAANNGGS